MSSRRSFSYSRPVNSPEVSSRQSPQDSPIHRLPPRRSPMRRPMIRRGSRPWSHSRSPRRRRYSFSRSRSRSASPVRRYNASPRRREYAVHRRPRDFSPRRSGSRSRNFRRSRSRSRKPLERETKESHRQPLDQHSQRKGVSPPRQLNKEKSSITGSMTSERISSFIPANPVVPVIPAPHRVSRFASSIKLSDAIISALKSPPQQIESPAQPKGTQEKPQDVIQDQSIVATIASDATQDNDMNLGNLSINRENSLKSDHPMHIEDATVRAVQLVCQPAGHINADADEHISMSPRRSTSTPLALTSPNPHTTIQTPESPPQGDIHECIQELAQTFTSMVKSRIDTDLQGPLPMRGEGDNDQITKLDLQAYCDSAIRCCERMVAVIVKDVTCQATKAIDKGSTNMQGVEYTSDHYQQLERRICLLEQQKLDQAALEACIEKKLELKLEQMIESRLGKQFTVNSPETALLPNKRRRRDISPISTPLCFHEETPEEKKETRMVRLEETVSKLESVVKTLTQPGPAVLGEGEETPKSLMDRVSALEDDSKQVFGYLSVHQAALVSFDSSLSLDPSKPFGQEIHKRLDEFRGEMAHMLTDAVSSLEDSLARVIVEVIVNQTKREMEASYEMFARELSEKFAPKPAK